MSWYLAVLKNYAGFSGRARRKEYWMFTLFNMIVSTVLVVLGIAVMVATESPVAIALFALYMLATVVPSIAVTVRRLHDIGRPGGWFFIAFVPFVGGIILLVWTCTEGQREQNRFGPSPKVQPALV